MMKILRKIIKKKKGTADFIYPSFTILVVVIIICSSLMFELIQTSSTDVDDGLTSALMASACLPVKTITTPDKFESQTIKNYDVFKSALKENLNLDAAMCPIPGTINATTITSDVVINKYIYYGIYLDGGVKKVMKVSYLNSTVTSTEMGLLSDNLLAENGTKIVTDTFYAEIQFTVKTFLSPNNGTLVKKDYLVDVVDKNK